MSVKDFREATEVQDSLHRAYENSYYAICGAGGPLEQWIDGYTHRLEEDSIGAPTEWIVATGAQVNQLAGEVPNPQDLFPDDLTVLLFSLDGLDAGKLAAFKLQWGDRWFDDIIDNMRRS